MLIQSYPFNVPGGLPVNRGFLVRGLTNPPTPLDEVGRVDMPEIEASYRVSFSDEAQACSKTQCFGFTNRLLVSEKRGCRLEEASDRLGAKPARAI